MLIVVDTCTMAYNGSAGLGSQTGASGSAIIRVTNSTIYHNLDGMLTVGAGAIESYGNNRVTANTYFSTFSGTVALQ